MSLHAILDKAAAGHELTADDGEALFTAEGETLERLLSLADQRRSQRGDPSP